MTIINDAFNANPDSTRAALKALVAIGRSRGARTWAVLGEMLELGDASADEHDAIGRLVVRLDVNRLLVVGDGRETDPSRRLAGRLLGQRVGLRRQHPGSARAAALRAARG